MAKAAYQHSKKYSWEDCAKNTWQFIVECSFKIG
jgi:hypothetical protein